MKRTQLIAQHLLDVHSGNNWAEVNLVNTLEEISWKDAFLKTKFSPNSIAMLLHHITYWNRAVAQRGKGIVPEITIENGFNLPPILSAVDWQQLKEDNLLSARELARVIEDFEEEKLDQPILPDHSIAYKNFQGQVEHVHYHLGQMVMLKKSVASSKQH